MTRGDYTARMHRSCRLLLLAAALAAAGARAQESDALGRWLHEQGHAADTAAAATRDAASELVVAAMNYLGVRYTRGGNGFEQGFDCSGFTRHLYAGSLGLVLPRRAEEQAQAAQLAAVDAAELQPGDLVFFNTLRRSYSHVGIYIGGGRFIHAPRSGAKVRVEDMRSAYWAPRYDGARRAQTLVAARPAAPRAPAGGNTPREPIIAFVL
jgi:cell wall-associated NlpC family hydrolase